MQQRLVLVGLLACHDAPAPATPVAPLADAPVADASVAEVTRCASDEQQWGSTCCRVHRVPLGQHDRNTGSCHGPQLGKVCHAKTDCDMACQCDPALVHEDGLTGQTGTCVGLQPAGEWLCNLDDKGRVSSLIID